MSDIEGAVRKQYGNIKDFSENTVVTKFLEGDVYYAEFKDSEGEEDFCYAFKKKDEILLFDDGVSVIKEFQALLDKRRSLLQRLNEFGLFDLVAAAIASIFALVFAGLAAFQKPLNNDFVALFTLLVGYLFGKKTPGPE